MKNNNVTTSDSNRPVARNSSGLLDLSSIRGNSSILVEELRDNGCRFHSQTSIRCPFHEDTTPSAEIRLQNGVYRFVCHAASCKVCEDFFGVRARFQGKTSDQVIAEYRAEKGGELPKQAESPRQEKYPKPEHRDRPATPQAVAAFSPANPKNGKLGYAYVDQLGKDVRVFETADAWKRSYNTTDRALFDYADGYTDPRTGEAKHLKIRYEPGLNGKRKGFATAHIHTDGKVYECWPKDVKKPLYLNAAAREAYFESGRIDSVVLTEGEKAADALGRHDIAAASTAFGAKLDARELEDIDFSILQDAKITLWPDFDPITDLAGRDERGRGGVVFMEIVQDHLIKNGIASSVQMIDPGRIHEMPEKGDAANVIERLEGEGEVGETLEGIIQGAIMAESSSDEHDGVAGRIGREASHNPILEILKPNPFPLELLPEPIADFISERAVKINVDPKSIALPLLTTTAGAVASTRQLEINDDYCQPAINWTLILDGSGTRKSSCLDASSQFLQERQDIDHAAFEQKRIEFAEFQARKKDKKNDLAEDASEIEDPREFKQIFTNEFTIEAIPQLIQNNQRGLTILADEFSGTLASFGRYAMTGKNGTEEAMLNAFWNGKSYTRNRASNANPKNKLIYLPYAHTTIAGFIQPALMMGAINDQMLNSGFLARFIMGVPQRLPAKRLDRSEVKREHKARMQKMFAHLLGLTHQNGKSVVVGLSDAAKNLYDDFDFEIQQLQQNRKLDVPLMLFINKATAHASRLALTLHMAAVALGDQRIHSENELDQTSLASGIKLARWAIEEQRRAYGLLTIGGSNSQLPDVTRYVMSQPGGVTDAVRYAKNRGVNAETAHAHLKLLLDAQIAHRIPHPIGAAGGRPKADSIQLLPELCQIWKSSDDAMAA